MPQRLSREGPTCCGPNATLREAASLYLCECREHQERICRSLVPNWAFIVFITGGVGLEMWHVAEHGVIISNVLANDGCPCPGILDSRLGIGDSVLHFFYNTLTYIGILFAFWYVVQEQPMGES